MPDPAAQLAAEQAVAAAVAGVPALVVALVGWSWSRRDDRATIRALREENARLLDALERALERKAG